MESTNCFQEFQISDLIIMAVVICFAIVFRGLAHIELPWSWVFINQQNTCFFFVAVLLV